MRDAEFIRNLAQVSLHAALVLHDRCPADHLQVPDFCQTIKNLVLYPVSEKRVFGIGTQIFKWKHRNPRRHRMGGLTLPKHHTRHRRHGDQRCHQHRTSWIPSHPFSSAGENSSAPGPNRLMSQPTVKILLERSGGLVASVRIGVQTTTDDCPQIAVERRRKGTQTRRRSRSSLMNNSKDIRAYKRRPAS